MTLRRLLKGGRTVVIKTKKKCRHIRGTRVFWVQFWVMIIICPPPKNKCQYISVAHHYNLCHFVLNSVLEVRWMERWGKFRTMPHPAPPSPDVWYTRWKPENDRSLSKEIDGGQKRRNGRGVRSAKGFYVIYGGGGVLCRARP